MGSSSRNYYTLVVRENDQWLVQFGDFNKEVVNDEMDDSYGDYKKKDLKVICTAESQEQIDTEVRNLNLAIESDKEAYRNELRDELKDAFNAYNQYSEKIRKLSKKLPQNCYESLSSLLYYDKSNRVREEALDGINRLKL
jgi:hypothetical protein